MSDPEVSPTRVPISFQVPAWRKVELEREAAEFGASRGKPISLSKYIREALDAFTTRKAA